MTYAVAEALQAAVYQSLQADATLTGLVGAAIYDQVPSGTIPSTYVLLGPETVTGRSDKTGNGADHRFDVSVVTDQVSFASVKAVAVAISDALHDQPLTLTRGHLVSLQFERAGATRDEAAGLRRVDLRFRARVEDN